MTNENTQKRLLEQIDILLKPLVDASSDDIRFEELFIGLGWRLKQIQGIPIIEVINSINSVVEVVDDIKFLIQNPPNSLADLANVLEITSDLFETVNSIDSFVDTIGDTIPETQKTELRKLSGEILDFLSTVYLENNSEKLYTLLVVLGIIDSRHLKKADDPVFSSDGWVRNERNYSKIRYDKIGALFSDPVQYLKDEFLPLSGVLQTTEDARVFSDKLFGRLELLFTSLGFEVGYGVDPDYYDLMDSNTFDIIMRTFTVVYHPSETTSAGASFVFSPNDEGGHGLVISPFGDWNFFRRLEKWIVKASISGSIEGLSINGDGVTFPSTFANSNLDFTFLVQRLFEGETKFYQIGSVTGTRLEIGRTALEAFGLFNNNPEYGIALLIERLALYVGGGEGDNFLNNIFTEPIKAEFDLKVGWTNILGFYFQGSGSLKIAIPVYKELYGLKLDVVYVALTFENGQVLVELSADTGLEIGPFSASVSRLGLNSHIKFEKGNLGPLDASIKFKPPTGIGFSIDSSGFKGGGFLSFDFDQERYVGALELTVKDKVSLKVIGILTTKLPGNDDGFSLLLLITAEFQPINLGFGFTLNGVGGLIALHRTMNLNYLRDGVKANTLDNILFPTDPIANINQIISDLEGAFPVQEGRYAFGPMAIIGWGTPTLISIELGLMIEVPNPVRIAILGVVKAILPTEQKSLLKLQVNFLGTLDFEAKFITFDASIFASKLLSFTLEGDMAFRLKYGDNPNFLFSIGGFHPAYTPPPLQLPSLKRLTINLVAGDNPRITLTAYFALTSNTVQFGSAVDFYYKITNKYSVVGYLGFDILIQFNPFYLMAQIAASLALMKNGNSLASIYLGGSVAGPAPWHVKGKAELEICGITLKANFDKTFGQPEVTTLPDVLVLPKLVEALGNRANWQASTPSSSNLLVSLRELDSTPGNIVAHPFGTLGVSQKVVPLDMTINKFGTQRPADYKKFELDIADSTGTVFEEEALKDFFAPAEYLQLNDSAKLSRKSFEQFNSGVSIKGNNKLKSSYLMDRELMYEQVIMDSRNKPEKLPTLYAEKPIAFRAFTKNGTAAKSSLGSKIKPISQNSPAKVSVTQEGFAIAFTEDLGLYQNLTTGSEAEARVILDQLLANDPKLTDKIQVVPQYQVA
jgi:hypothetical protein